MASRLGAVEEEPWGGRTAASATSKGATDMMTVVTHTTLRQGAEPEWHASMRQRLSDAAGRPGFVRSQLLMPLDGLDRRIIVGTWATRADWEAWHDDESFLASRHRLEELEQAAGETTWYEVVEEQTPGGVGRTVDAAVARLRGVASRIASRSARA